MRHGSGPGVPGSERSVLGEWKALDQHGAPRVVWVRPPRGRRVAVMLGAFDPPTNAHVSIARGASRALGVAGALCVTKVVLDRPGDRLLSDEDRVRLVERLAEEEGLAFAMANRGTYLDVARALRAGGLDATFVIGSDKLAQLEDPSFYDDADGVAATFAEVRFLVVPRPGAAVHREDVVLLDPGDAFEDLRDAAVSATEVRRRVRAGRAVDAFVPRVVAESLEGYTAAEPR